MWRMMSACFVASGLMCGCMTSSSAWGKSAAPDAVVNAISEDADVARAARDSLRREGPAGLDKLMVAHRERIARHLGGDLASRDNWSNIAAAIDAVAMQRDAWASGLYWYTDLDAARAAAQRDGKPILSLRLLGTLDAEMSCANSRFFRTTLYPAPEVSKRLRENFVLHWSSERPVPVVTVDFGDGRVMKRTVTGNSAHYAMTPDGQVVDVLPGLYSATAFARWLDETAVLANEVASFSSDDRRVALRDHHALQRDEIARQWAADVEKVSVSAGFVAQPNAVAGTAPSAREAGQFAIGKSFVEAPLVAIVSRDDADLDPSTADDALWASIAALHADEAALDPGAIGVIRAKAGANAVAAGELARTKRRAEDPLARLLVNLQQSIALDTVRNEYMLHAQVHEWFARGEAPSSFEKLNERVYAELFLTPRSDPWLGLAPEDAWSALDGGGLSTADAGQ